MRMLVFLKDIFRKFPRLLVTGTFLMLMMNLAEAASLFSLIVVVDLFINPGLHSVSPITRQIISAVSALGIPATLGWVLGIFLVFNVAKILFQIYARYFTFKIQYAVLGDIMLGTFEDFFNARWYFFSSSRQGIILNTFIREVYQIGDSFGALTVCFSSLLQIALYLAVPLCLSWKITLLTVAVSLIFTLPFFLLGKISYRAGAANTATANKMSGVIQEGLGLAKIILGFGNQDKVVGSLRRSFQAHRQAAIRCQVLNFATPLAYYPFGLLVLIIGLFISRRLSLPLAETAVLFYSLAKVIPSVGNLTGEKTRIDNLFPSYEQVLNLKQRARELAQHSGVKRFGGFRENLSLRRVSFAYPGNTPVLRDIDLEVPKGRMVAVVGESGSGKTTLLDIIMGFYQPSSGSIEVDDVPLSEFEINSYRRLIGYVPQESVLFNLSIKDNLLWARPDASPDELKVSCRLANAEEFISQLPAGYDTIVGDRGVRLSGGQVQRIALARAILRRPQLLILDEATSSLDTYSERLIQQAIEQIAKETTIVVVAHRLSTIVRAGRIYVLVDGRVAEEGSYEELVARCGHFSRMAQLQALGVPA